MGTRESLVERQALSNNRCNKAYLHFINHRLQPTYEDCLNCRPHPTIVVWQVYGIPFPRSGKNGQAKNNDRHCRSPLPQGKGLIFSCSWSRFCTPFQSLILNPIPDYWLWSFPLCYASYHLVNSTVIGVALREAQRPYTTSERVHKSNIPTKYAPQLARRLPLSRNT